MPPQKYGGTERVVSYLTEELVRRGHAVTLFASGGSQTAARLVASGAEPLRLDAACHDPLSRHLVHLEEVFRRAAEFDIIHFHVDYLHYPLSRRHRLARLTTLHGRLDIPDLVPLYREYAEEPVVSISDAQRAPLPWLNWQATVYHGLPLDLHRPGEGAGAYLVFLGRISPEKRPDLAIEIARRAGLSLVIAAKVDRNDREYFTTTIEPLLDQPHVLFVGEVDQEGKQELLAGASAMLLPVDWPEPFGLVMIESMACGTPVVAFRRGSIPEVIDEGVTGFVCDSVEEAVAAVGRTPSLSRRRCRERFVERFAAGRMADDYLALYARISEGRGHGRDHQGPGAVLHPGHLVAGR